MGEDNKTLGEAIGYPGSKKDEKPGMIGKGFNALSEALKKMASKSADAKPEPSPSPDAQKSSW